MTPYRTTISIYEAIERHGWKSINSWPDYGEPGKCRACGKALTKRQRKWCGSTECKVAVWYRLYCGVRWAMRHVIVRDGCVCRMCGELFEKPLREGGPNYPLVGHLELDHIIPLIDGGTEAPENLQVLCRQCHKTKTRREAAQRAIRVAGGKRVVE